MFEDELHLLKDQCLYRQVKTLQPTGAVTAVWQGREIVLFCGNDYLGMSRHPRVMQAAKKAVDRYGTGAGAARLISGTSQAHTDLEEKIARVRKKERALLFSAGYLANLGVLSALAGEGDLIVMDKLCHASLIDGARLSGARLRIFPHRNYARCEEILQQEKNTGRTLLVSDTVFSMDGDLAEFKELIRLKKTYGCLWVADDAHGMGVMGQSGGGALEDGGFEGEADVITGTLSKALGSLGGFAAASASVIEYLINKARPFIFATALPPAVCAAALEALQVLEEEPDHRYALWRNIQRMHEALTAEGWPLAPITSPILPLMIGAEGDALAFSESLLQQGFFVPAVRYPTVAKGKARLRITVSAAHTPNQIQQFTETLRRIKKQAAVS
ncbi:MAG: 8-amino-7-oxononanoate synthase [Candidatus Omnitrophica bacterium]|nr:8-amino-7-oxononanoate synthase [Candidatus Omnitrophota bacterium]